MLTSKERKYYKTALAYYRQLYGDKVRNGKVVAETVAFDEFWRWYVMNHGEGDKISIKEELKEEK